MLDRPKVISGGRVIDPNSSTDEMRDILIRDGKIEDVAKPGTFADLKDAESVDATGKVITPGLIDIHVHFREPGFEWKETVATGSAAAVAGGFTTVCCMPNTNPVIDNASVAEFVLEQAKRAGLCRVLPIGAITAGQKGKSLAPMLELKEAGCVAFSDDGYPVSNAAVMRKALEYSLMLDTVLTCHEEELSLSDKFSMNESALSLKLGLKGMPGAAEDVMISRDIELSRLTGARVHFCHVSTARAVTLIRRAKEDGITVTAEVTPHHLKLDESCVSEYDTYYKMSMPLRREEDIAALRAGLSDGTIDCIASDHAPHELDSKRKEFSEASFGILGLQTTLPIVLDLVRGGSLSLSRAVESLTSSPANCFGLSAGTLSRGASADLAVIDLDRKFKFSKEVNRSKSENSPFMNSEFQGVAMKTFFGGEEVFSYDK